jgi:glycosyltransferase involved in cell wall biosynthesis
MRPAGRVEMILPSLIAAGMEMVTYRLSLGLVERGWDVGVTCLQEDGELAHELRSGGVRVRTVPEPGFVGNLRPASLAPWLAQVRPDVVHVHSGAWIKGAHAARLAGVGTVVFTEHGLAPREPWYSPLLKRWGAHYCDHVVAVSEPLGEYLRLAGISGRKLHVILNGVDTRRFVPAVGTGALRAEFGIGAAPLIGHVARLAPEKNQHRLIEALASLDGGTGAPHLVLVGAGPLEEALREHATSLRVGERVHFAGVRRDMPAIYREFDVFVLPSLAEGTSMSVLEAMACGCAIVASSVGGTPAMLDGGSCGILVGPTDVPGLAEALRMVIADPAGQRGRREAARRRAVEHFSEERMVEAYERLYAPRRITTRET